MYSVTMNNQQTECKLSWPHTAGTVHWSIESHFDSNYCLIITLKRMADWMNHVFASWKFAILFEAIIRP